MTEIEKMERHIEITAIPSDLSLKYDLNFCQIKALWSLDRTDAIMLAFGFGVSKGYRMAKAEGKTLQQPV